MNTIFFRFHYIFVFSKTKPDLRTWSPKSNACTILVGGRQGGGGGGGGGGGSKSSDPQPPRSPADSFRWKQLLPPGIIYIISNHNDQIFGERTMIQWVERLGGANSEVGTHLLTTTMQGSCETEWNLPLSTIHPLPATFFLIPPPLTALDHADSFRYIAPGYLR